MNSNDYVNNLKRIPELDGLRGLAISMVIFGHFNGEAILMQHFPLLGPIITKFALIGLRGVDLFFILSGFLITRILIATKNESHFFSNFYARRVLRIFPIYYLSLFVIFIVLPHFVQFDTPAILLEKSQWRLWLYLQNFPVGIPNWDSSSLFWMGHFWSLAVEEHFYIFWPFIIYRFEMKAVKRISLYWFFSSIFFGLFFIQPWVTDVTKLQPWSSLSLSGALALGSYIGIRLWEDTNLSFFEKKMRGFLPISFLLFCFLSFLPRQMGAWSDFLAYLRCYASWFVFSGLFVVLFKGGGTFFTPLRNVLNSKFLCFLGTISYGLYVYHGILRPIFETIFDRKNLVVYFGPALGIIIYLVLAIGLSVLLAWLSWNLIEKRILHFKRYFENQRKGATEMN